MKHAFEKAGFDRLRFDAEAFCKNFFQFGGTLDLWMEIGQQTANEMGKIGQNTNVREDQMPAATLSHPMPEGHVICVREDQITLADGQPKPSEGHVSPVQQDYRGYAPPRSPIPSEGQSLNVQSDHPAPAPAGNLIGGEDQLSSVHQDHETRVPSADPLASKKASAGMPTTVKGILPSARDPDDAFRRALTKDRMQNAAIWLDLNKTSDGRYWSKICPYEFDGMERDARTVHHIKFVFGEFNSKQRNTPLGKLLTPDLQKKLAHRVDLMEGRRV